MTILVKEAVVAMFGTDNPHSVDARTLAKEFIAADPDCGMSEDELIKFFRNADECGWDERTWETKDYKALVRRTFYPWWSWKRYLPHRARKLENRLEKAHTNSRR